MLGPVSAEADGALVPLGGRKQRAVFALLALNANRVVSLDRLVHEVWQDEPPARATLALQSYVSRLRRLLAGLQEKGDGSITIVTRPPGWVLQIPADDVDVLQFTALLADGNRLLESGQVTEGAARLRAGLELWGGDPLSDLDEAPFAVEHAARLTRVRLAAMETLLDAELEAGGAGAVVERAREFVQENPFRERAWCALMLSLYRSGRQADALAAARELRKTLGEGLGIDPSPEARRLEERILQQDPSLDAPAAVAPSRPMSAVPMPAVPMPAADQPDDPRLVGELLGRQVVLDGLRAAVAEAAAGRGRLLLVDGPAGMGKTSVLEALVDEVARAGGLALRGAGVATGAMPALWPWVTIVRQLTAARPDLVEGAAATSAGALVLLDPSVGTGASSIPWASDDPALARTRLYRAVIDLVGGQAATGLVAVVIDDAQWLDPETVSLLALAVDELTDRGVLFVLAGRSDEPAAVEAVAAAVRRTAVVRMPLEGLDEADVGRVVQRVSGMPADPSVAAAVFARTAGNPFFVLELVQLLTSERRLDPRGAYDFLPDGVRDVLRRRLDRLPEQTLALLTVAALVGRAVGVELLTQVTGLDEDAVLGGCESAVLAGLLVDGGYDGFAISHDLVRQTLDESVSSSRRVRLHARVAASLQKEEAAGGQLLPEQVVELAHHLTLAAPVIGPAEALPYLIAAADDARARLAFHQAEAFLRSSLELIKQVPGFVERVQAEQQVQGRLAGMMVMAPGTFGSGHSDEVLPPLDPDLPADWWAVTLFAVAAGRGRQALAAAELAWEPGLPSQAAVAVQSLLGFSSFVLGRFDDAGRAFELCEALIDGGPEAVLPGAFTIPVSARTLRSAIALLADDRAAAADLLRSARGKAGTSAPDLVIVEYFSAWSAAVIADPSGATSPARACVDHALLLGNSLYVPLGRVLEGWSRALQGDESGLLLADEAIDGYLEGGMRFQSVVSALLCAEAHAHYGHHDVAQQRMQEAAKLVESTGELTIPSRLQPLLAATVG
jgi:DNA-binding SARP family transcriptional activator